MKNIVNVRVNEEGSITLPKEILNKMCLMPGDSLQIEYTTQSMAERCFTMSEDNDEDLFEGEWYCIPMRLLEQVGIESDDTHVVVKDNEILITNTRNVMGVIPPEYIEAMNEQGIDFDKLADAVVGKVNEYELEGKY